MVTFSMILTDSNPAFNVTASDIWSQIYRIYLRDKVTYIQH